MECPKGAVARDGLADGEVSRCKDHTCHDKVCGFLQCCQGSKGTNKEEKVGAAGLNPWLARRRDDATSLALARRGLGTRG
jgi:hypothetical protein